MTADAWLTLAVVVGIVVALVRDWLSPAATMLGATVLLLSARVLAPAEALAGFSNAAPMTVAALYVVARAVEKTGALQPMVSRALGTGRSPRVTLARVLAPTAAVSAFLNNTPIVALMAPQVGDWCGRNGLSPSRYLMPLSFATMLGGVVTAIGTSTNLVVSGLLEARGRPQMGLFEISAIGLPVAVAGVLFLIWFSASMLPERRPARRQLEESRREFVVNMAVVDGGPLDGRAVAAGGLRQLEGVFLVEIERRGQIIAPVTPATVLYGGDRLTFIGRADLVVDLQTARGLSSAEEKHLVGMNADHTFFEAVIGTASPLVGKTLREADFRSRYQAAVVAIHRAGQRVQAKLGGVRLGVGDTLIVLGDPGFRDRWRDRNDFLLVAPLGGTPPHVGRRAWLVGLVSVSVVVLAGSGLMPILEASLAGAVALVALGVLTPAEARSAVDLDVIVLIAASFGVAAAVERSGLAAQLGSFVVGTMGTFGPRGVLLGIVLGTILLTELVTNNAAAALMFPIAMAAATSAGLDERRVALAVAVSASASFLTPIGYQTNTMVYGPGGYRFGDYARLGTPLTLLVILVVMLYA